MSHQVVLTDAFGSAIAEELSLAKPRVEAALALLAGGATVPFIARYRKEMTGSLDEVELRAIEERSGYLKELEERRATVLTSIEEQGMLSADLRARILSCRQKAELEDLYLPFRPKRRTRASIARGLGLDPLAQRILTQPGGGSPRQDARAYVRPDAGVADVEAALSGARDIVAETIAETASVRAWLRQRVHLEGTIASKATKAARETRSKFEQYYDHEETVRRLPSHRYLAMCRGEDEGALRIRVSLDPKPLPRLLQLVGQRKSSPWSDELEAATVDCYDRLLLPSIVSELRREQKERADQEAIEVFATNTRELLLSPPLGPQAVVGIDPGLRTGCKCAAVDGSGEFLDSMTIFPHTGPQERAREQLGKFIARFRPEAIAIGNGTAGRETLDFVRETLRPLDAPPQLVLVNESGASVYSASDLAREEFPDLDLTVRGAISIARRLQDPLAELVKLDPKVIGVGQYQHDVHQGQLKKKLSDVVESCVNAVGVDANTASSALLGYVSGLGPKLAKAIVSHREKHGLYTSRAGLMRVSGLGAKTFEQCAGFLRVRGSRQPLDGSAVHPERYGLVEHMARDLGVAVEALVGKADLVAGIQTARYVSAEVGEPTLRDILDELRKPGRDPRKTFEAPDFRDDVRSLEDLAEGMVLDGVVTNVTHFGAFVDIGVHQDGLVHVSQLADRFVRDPHEVAHVGQRLRVRVVSVDRARKRIGLSARDMAQR